MRADGDGAPPAARIQVKSDCADVPDVDEFFPRTIHDWNKLPPTTTCVQTIEAFKTALHA